MAKGLSDQRMYAVLTSLFGRASSRPPRAWADEDRRWADPEMTVHRRVRPGAGHANVTAYFHGNSNWNQFYDGTGAGHSIILHTFRVDSPMKGAVSSKDETKLWFQVVTIDMTSRTMTVREGLWHANPRHPGAPLARRASTTVAFPR